MRCENNAARSSKNFEIDGAGGIIGFCFFERALKVGLRAYDNEGENCQL
jgi:hypothetical protein